MRLIDNSEYPEDYKYNLSLNAPVLAEPEKPSLGEVFKASLTNNPFYNIFDSNNPGVKNQYPNRDETPLTHEDKVDYIANNPWIIENDKAIQAISGASVRADIFDFEQQVKYENEQRDIISRASTANALLAGAASGALDPTSWLPIGNVYKAAKASWGVAKSALSVGAATAGTISLQEMILQQQQYTRTFEESVANVFIGGTVGSIFGGAIGYFVNNPNTIKAMTTNVKSVLNGDTRKVIVDGDEISMVVNGKTKKSLGSVGAAAAEKVDETTIEFADKLREENTLYNVPAYIAKLMKQTPYFRLIQSPFGWYRRFAADNLANASILNKYNEGISSGTSIELEVSDWMGKMFNTQFALEGAYQKYTGITGGFFKNTRAWRQAQKSGKMSREAFNQEVYRAAISGDEHAIPEVKSAIQEIRPFFEELKNEAVKLKLLPENVGVSTAVSYMMRVYNRQLIERNRFIVQDAEIVSEPFQQKVERYLRDTQDKLEELKPEIERIKKLKTENVKEINKLEDKKKKLNIEEKKVNNFSDKKREKEKQRVDFIVNEYNKNLSEINEQLEELYNTELTLNNYFKEKYPNLVDSDGNLYKIIPGKYKETTEYNAADPYTPIPGKPGAEYDALITAHADSIIDNILGLGSEVINNRFNIGVKPGQGGGKPLNNRVFKIPDTEIAEYLEKDMGQIIRQYGRNMGFAVAVARYAQKIGVPESESISSYFSKMAKKELDELIKRNPKDIEFLNKRFSKDQEDMNNSIVAIQGFFGLPQGTFNQNIARWLTAVKQWQVMRLLGMVAAYIPVDQGLSIFQHGLSSWYKDGILPLIKSGSLKKFTKEQANDIGLALETESGRLFQSMVTGAEVSHNKNKYELIMEKASRGFGNLNLTNQAEDIQSSINANIAKANIVRNIIAWKNGTLSKAKMRDMAVARIDKDYYPVIYEQLEKTGSLEEIKGSYYMNLNLWDQTDDAVMAASQVKQGIHLMIEQGSMRTSFVGDRPLATRTTFGSALFLFKNFLWATQNKLLFNSIIQRRDQASVEGTFAILAFGALAYVIRQTAYGRPIEKEKVLFEAIDNSGILSMVFEPSLSLLKFFGFGPAQDASRYYGRSDWSLLLGPTFSIIEDGTRLARVTNGFFGWENVTEKDIQKTFQLLPGSNLAPINPLVRYSSNQIAQAFDLETIEE